MSNQVIPAEIPEKNTKAEINLRRLRQMRDRSFANMAFSRRFVIQLTGGGNATEATCNKVLLQKYIQTFPDNKRFLFVIKSDLVPI